MRGDPGGSGRAAATDGERSGAFFFEPKSSQSARLVELLARCHGHNQVNDTFLLWIALTRGATLLTFDTPLRHLAPGPELVEVIA